jgi:hypothetical protein
LTISATERPWWRTLATSALKSCTPRWGRRSGPPLPSAGVSGPESSCPLGRSGPSRYTPSMPPLTAVRLPVIERIFEILDRLGISREAVIIPLKPAHPGSVTVLPNGKTQIVVDSETPLEVWLPELEAKLRAMLEGTG